MLGWGTRSNCTIVPPASVKNFRQVAPRDVSTKQTLQALRQVANIRDLAEACPQVQPGRVLRSACPASASPEDVHALRSNLGITHLVDLRSDYERKLDQRFLLLENADGLRSVRRRGRAEMETFMKPAGGENGAQRLTVLHISLLERLRYYRGLLKRMPLAQAVQVFLMNFYNPLEAKATILREINRGGLPELYQVILETSRPEICCALQEITEAVAADKRVLFFCKIGKDRTGLIAALILSVCGASDNEIISDYTRSDNVEQVALGGIEKENLSAIDAAMFSRAPPEAMATVLRYCRQVYGGVSEFLESIGFSKAEQARLRRALTKAADAAL
ncbi:hypothetical protein WJX72_010783 [[Myrmecia] bisecta]|uniref:Tyrosine specific protein phosphatases domain-containing protein n=1 Tax=[Myrmecia] bisecta TaxID=41462 RepID=A0AAW1Q8C3_9CHLO